MALGKALSIKKLGLTHTCPHPSLPPAGEGARGAASLLPGLGEGARGAASLLPRLGEGARGAAWLLPAFGGRLGWGLLGSLSIKRSGATRAGPIPTFPQWGKEQEGMHGSCRSRWKSKGTTSQTPCLRDASMKGSRSPSSTFWVADISTLVRRSLMRLLSST